MSDNTRWHRHAHAIAEAWGRPRPGGFPPGVPLAYMSEKSFWQAVNREGFEGTLEEWTAEVERTYQALGLPPHPTEAPTGNRAHVHVKTTPSPPAPEPKLEPPPTALEKANQAAVAMVEERHTARKARARVEPAPTPMLEPVVPSSALDDLEEWLNL